MRVRFLAFLFSVFSLYAVAGPSDGDSCIIPKLEPGVPANVRLEYIDKKFCGVALIDGHYQKLTDITSWQEESRVTCENAFACHKIIKYYSAYSEEQEPYIINFSGPKTRKGA